MFKASRAKYEENNDRRRKLEIVGSLSLRHFYVILRTQIVCLYFFCQGPLCVYVWRMCENAKLPEQKAFFCE